MTEQCNTCLGCQQMENPDFRGVYRCPVWADGRELEPEPEPEQVRLEDRE